MQVKNLKTKFHHKNFCPQKEIGHCIKLERVEVNRVIQVGGVVRAIEIRANQK